MQKQWWSIDGWNHLLFKPSIEVFSLWSIRVRCWLNYGFALTTQHPEGVNKQTTKIRYLHLNLQLKLNLRNCVVHKIQWFSGSHPAARYSYWCDCSETSICGCSCRYRKTENHPWRFIHDDVSTLKTDVDWRLKRRYGASPSIQRRRCSLFVEA